MLNNKKQVDVLCFFERAVLRFEYFQLTFAKSREIKMETMLEIFVLPSLRSVLLKGIRLACGDSQLQSLSAVFSECVVTFCAA